jgi:hypothetical protein
MEGWATGAPYRREPAGDWQDRRMSSTDSGLREFLLAQSPVWLTDRLLGAAASDPPLLVALQLAASGSDGVHIVRRELDRALWVDEYVEEDDAPTYVYEAERALGLLEDMVREGRPDDAIELAEHAIELLREAVERVADDGPTHGCLVWAQEIHTQACAAGDPDPVALAERLFSFAVADEWGAFTDVLHGYGDVLGPTGLARLRGLIAEELQRLPRVAAGRRPDLRHSTILALAEQAARADGVDAVVDVIARDLSSAHRFERICHELESAGRVDEALAWARRGIAEVQPEVDRLRIRQTAAALAGRSGRHSEAAEYVWQDFAKAPTLEGYQRLRQHGEADGSWSEWRDRALRTLRAAPPLAKPARPGQPAWAQPAGHSELVKVLLWEGDVPAAWQAAQHGGCTEGVWLMLARRRAEQEPGDAVPVLRRHAEAAVELTKQESYERAASLLTEVGRCYERANAAAQFVEYIRGLRATHRRKRNFIAVLDAARLPG